jgi:hypothetical protein
MPELGGVDTRSSSPPRLAVPTVTVVTVTVVAPLTTSSSALLRPSREAATVCGGDWALEQPARAATTDGHAVTRHAFMRR